MSTGILHEQNRTGDTRVEWDKDNADEVEIARKAFNAAKKKGRLVYKTRADGSRAEVLHEFDPNAERIVTSPPLVGG
jgi:hypothetical protein